MTELRLRVPGDKSLTHRALLLAALADGESIVRRALTGADTRSTAAVLRALGCAVPDLDAEVRIRGLGLHGLTAPAAVLDCGNSGTTARLLLGTLAGCAFQATLDGDESLRGRPMRRVTAPLQRMGAHFAELGQPDRLPIRITGGALQALDYGSPHASAQVKSALLLAGLVGGVPVRVREPGLSRDHTERLLGRLGVKVHRRFPGGVGDPAEVALEPVARLDAFEFDVPGDPSSAAFLAAAVLLHGGPALRIEDVGVNPTRAGFLDVLRRMGADIRLADERESCGEPIADLEVRPAATLRGTRIGGAEVPSLVDEIPVLAALAARAEGITEIRGAGELRVKESDRIAVMVRNLRAVGVEAEELPDGLVVHGTDAPLEGRVDPAHDHRIAMAFGVLGTAPRTDIVVERPDVVDVSYPDFWTTLERLQHS